MKTGTRSLGVLSASILALSLGGCGNNTSSSDAPNEPVVDTLSPAITFSASDTSPQGGETIILSATVEDNVDADLVASLDCDGGLLRSEFLTTATTDESLTIQCFASAEDSAGNSASETLAIEVAPTIRRFMLLESGNALQPGSAVGFAVENLGITDEQIPASLDGVNVTLFNTNEGIVSFVIPSDASAGDSTFVFQIGEDQYNFDIPIETGETIADPTAFLSDLGNTVVAQLDDLTLNINNNLSEAYRAELTARRDAISDVLDNLSNFSEEELRETAMFLNANPQLSILTSPDSGSSKVNSSAQFSTEESCIQMARDYVGNTQRISVLVYTVAAGFTVGAATGGSLSAISTGIGLGALAVLLDTPIGPDNIATCVFDNAARRLGFAEQDQFEFKSEQLVIAKSLFKTESAIDFQQGVPVNFSLTTTRSFIGEAAEIFTTGARDLGNVIASLPFIPESLRDYVAEPETDMVEDISSNVFLDSVSDSDVDGGLVYQNGSGELTFTYIGADLVLLDEGVGFDFTLRAEDDEIGVTTETFEGNLSATPEAGDALVEITSVQPTAFDVEAFGDSLEIVSAPLSGTVAASGASAFIYTANRNSVGTDQFTFVSVLGETRSEEATVFIDFNLTLPTAETQSVTVVEGESFTGRVNATDFDTISVTSLPTLGELDLSTATGDFTYTPGPDTTGSDSFSYIAINANGNSEEVSFNFEILEEEIPEFIDDFFVSATLFINDDGCDSELVDDDVAGPFTAVSGTNRDAVFSISEISDDVFSISLPPQWRPIIGEETDSIISDELDEEGRPGFDLFRSITITDQGDDNGTFSQEIAMSFIDDSNQLRASNTFTASELDGDVGCSRTIESSDD